MNRGYGPPRILSPSELPKSVWGQEQIAYGVIQSVDNTKNPKYATVLVNNAMPGISGFTVPIGLTPFGPGGSTGFTYFYNNPSTGVGGSVVVIDLVKKSIISFTGNVSTAQAQQVYSKLATRTHVGNINPPQFPAVTPVSVSSSNANQGSFPYIASSGDILTPVQTSGNIISTGYSTDLTLTGGAYKQTVATTKNTVGVYVPYGAWFLTGWQSKNTGTGDWGPTITDGTNYYQLLASSTTGNISLVKNGTILYDVILGLTASTYYNFELAVVFIGGTSWRIKCWINGVEYIDYTDSFPGLSNTLYAGFKATANDVYHLDSDYYGSTDNQLLLTLPAATAPTISGITITYPFVASASNYIAKVSFTGPDIASWQGGIRISDSTSRVYGDIPANSTGSYSTLVELSSNAIDLKVSLVDLLGNVTSTTDLGTTSVPSATTGSTYTAAPVTTLAPSQFSYIVDTITNTYDAVCGIYLDSNGKSTNTSLLGIECLSALHNSSTYSVCGTIVPNSTGVYQPFWEGLSTALQYDLYIRYVDTNGNKGAVTLVGTTAAPPIYVTPLPVPDGVPVAPVVQPDSVSIHGTVSQTNDAASGALQDLLTQLILTNVPQDGSVDRALFQFKKHSITSASTASIVKSAFGSRLMWSLADDKVYAQFDASASYTPTAGNLVLLICPQCDLSGLSAGWNAISNYGTSYVTVFWKVWTGSDTPGELVCGNDTNAAWAIYEIVNANNLNPIQQIIYSPNPGSPPITTGALTPTELAVLPMAGFITENVTLSTDPGATTFTDGFTYSGTAYSDDISDPSTVVVGVADLTTDEVTPIQPAITPPSPFSAGSLFGFLLFIRSANPEGLSQWSDYSYVRLQPVPIPLQTQSVTEVYGQLATGITYDLAVAYATTDNVVGPRTIFITNYDSGIQLNYPGTVSSANAVVDSGFASTAWGKNNTGSVASNKSGINFNWKFYNIDGINTFLLKGGNNGQNNIVIDNLDSGIDFLAISEPIDVQPGQQWMISAYIDGRACSGGTTGGAFCALVDNTGSNTYTTIYAKVQQTNGQAGQVQLTNAWTVPTDVSQVCFMFSSDSVAISSSSPGILVFSLPMAEQNTVATGYVQGPANASDGSVRTPTVSTQAIVYNTGSDTTTLPTSPTTTGSSSAPVSGGTAPAADQQPPGSTRHTTGGNVYVQTNATPTTPTWEVVGTQDAQIVIYNQIFGAR